MQSRTKPKREVDVVTDYMSEPVVESSWGDESLEKEWLEAFGAYLATRPEATPAWERLKQERCLRDTIDVINGFTRWDADLMNRALGPEEEEAVRSSGFSYEKRRKTYAAFKDRFEKARRMILDIEEWTAHQLKDSVNDFTDPLLWPAERKMFVEWIGSGKELTLKLHQHFKRVSHASRGERDDYSFLISVFALRYRNGLTRPQIAALIASGIAAWGRRPIADNFDGEKLKYDLKRLKRAFPDLYRSIEEGIRAQRNV